MTVRTWLTISVIVVIALFVAVALKLTAPVNAPSIVARVGEIRLQGQRVASCWPVGNKTKCEGAASTAGTVTIPDRGTFRVIVAYPLQPKKGYIEVRSGANVVFKHDWKQNTSYELASGTFELIAHATYRNNAHVEYRFPLRVR